MKAAVLLAALCYAHVASGDTHSMKYITTAVSGIDGFPKYTTVGLVDDSPFVYFDSSIKKMIPKTNWIKENVGTDYWDRESQREASIVPVVASNIETARERFNQSAGIHTFQHMYGCEWDDETQQKNGWRQFGYDGEDFLALDVKTFRWIAPVHQAEASQRKWNDNPAEVEINRNYFTQTCFEWLQKYVAYGKASFQNKVSRPVGSLLQKDSSSGVVCHATGFYPEGVMITWKKDGEEMQDDVDVGETLPNEDGTFQKRAVLTVSPGERKNGQYSCEITHKSGESIVLNWEEANNLPIIIAVCVVVAALLVAGIVAAVITKKKGEGGCHEMEQTSYTKASQSDTSSDNSNGASKA